VCAIGSEVAANLFPNENPIGKIIKIGGYAYQVLGVFDKQGSFLGLQSLIIESMFRSIVSFKNLCHIGLISRLW